MLYLEDQVRKIKLNSGETSEREYVAVQFETTHTREYDYYAPETSTTNRSFYLDPETGLVVFDIETYEKVVVPSLAIPEKNNESGW